MSNPLQLITQWSGFLNNQPISALVRVKYANTKRQWYWVAEVFWESQYAIDHKMETGILWKFAGQGGHGSETEALRFAQRWLDAQGFQFEKEVQ